MFWTEEELGGKKSKAAIRVPPPVPETNWRVPTEYPNLSSATILSIDTETWEPDFDHGPGWSRGKGHMVGFSVGAEDGRGNRGKWYFPIRHELGTEDNLDPSTSLLWLDSVLNTPDVPKVGANLMYDIGWLREEGVNIRGTLHDVQFAEALLYEEGFVGLEYLGQKYCNEGKESSIMYEWLADAYGGSVNSDQRANIYRAPPMLVGPYAESDADLPLRIIRKQWEELDRLGLRDVYNMECDSMYLLTDMRQTGVRVDIPAAEQLYTELAKDISVLEAKLADETGFHANVNSETDLVRIFETLGVAYPKTAKGNPSFKKDFLSTIDHPIAGLIGDIRQHEHIRGTFIKSYLLEANVNGRVHCQFHPLRGDSGGTRSGRFASSNPNLQNIPVRSKLGKRVRRLFVPDHGHALWGQYDYSQIEYRNLAHFAVGPGADLLRDEYNQRPDTDYHTNTYQRICPFMGWDPACKKTADSYRKPVKNINFGLLYGMGKNKLGRSIAEYFKGNLSKKQIDDLFNAYHSANPYVKATMDATALEAQQKGYITTLTGRRSWFDKWEPRQINWDDRATPLKRHVAIANYGPDIQRAMTHKAINRRLQGSAADIIKRGMYKCWKDGVFDVIGAPKLQVHDELDFSVIDTSPRQAEAYNYMKQVLETATPLKVPVLVDAEFGPNWGDTA